MMVNPIIDNHIVHRVEHLRLALSSDFKTWPEEKQGALLQHLLEHEMYAMTGAPQGSMPPGGPGMPPGPGGPMPGAPAPGGPPGMSQGGNPTHPDQMAEATKMDSRMPPAPPEM